MTDISTFVAKHRRQVKDISIEERINKLPWYKRPIERSAFIFRKAKDGKYYVRHIEWAEPIWIGPYRTMKDVDGIISSYVEKSSVTPLNRITTDKEIHSVYIDDVNNFF
jgi:hypothetical protein